MALPQLNLDILNPNDLPSYPEKVIQFGTGVLLRGFVDYIIHQSNDAGEFQGRVVAVGSTGSGRTRAINEQNGLFTHWIEGIKDNQELRHGILNKAISRALSAVDQWEEVLKTAEQPEIQVIVSNTTEVGIQYVEEDIFQSPPSSYPAKLTALLHRRWEHHPGSSLVILPTELIIDNGTRLKEIVLKHAQRHGLGQGFEAYLHAKVHFCNTLVDRIVTGKPDEEKFNSISKELGYSDQMLTVAEPYFFWAIEGPQELLSILPFAESMEEVILTDDISPYRERKLRLLNGGHTISVALGHLAGFETVHDCMSDPHMGNFISSVMKDEIARSLPDEVPGALAFADEVIGRFQNPFLNHKLLSIALQYTSKMAMRVVPSILRYIDKTQEVPEKMALGFAAYLVFLRPTKVGEQRSEGSWNSTHYPITDKQAAWMKAKWEQYEEENSKEWLKELLSHSEVWGADLGSRENWLDKVHQHLRGLLAEGVKFGVPTQ